MAKFTEDQRLEYAERRAEYEEERQREYEEEQAELEADRLADIAHDEAKGGGVMAKLDFVPVTGYSVVYHVGYISAIVAQPILGLYVERHAFAVEVLTDCGEVIELSPTCVLELPDGKCAYADMVFDDEATWLNWVIELGRDDVCAECREAAEGVA